mmetsp:Transcript_674/g.1668  ORF Transcript_674/g.1668 Transcript_674/m.1668 type:complete len:81 (+) Transcript_674:692-934(+)
MIIFLQKFFLVQVGNLARSRFNCLETVLIEFKMASLCLSARTLEETKDFKICTATNAERTIPALTIINLPVHLINSNKLE